MQMSNKMPPYVSHKLEYDLLDFTILLRRGIADNGTFVGDSPI